MINENKKDRVVRQFDTYHADYFYVMGYEIGIVDGDLAQALRELPDRQLQIVLMYYFIGWTDREIGGILGLAKSTVCKWRIDAVKMLRRMVEEMYHGQ